ncbi:peptidoglycan DD-metalloendopeptidase family protein [Lysobacter solisilvae (ex Woo and Kim 2020)]|uniref:M23 family metallopeptidase n=1 Tax=Agrilutibacter terrestris TaxID=2865112 RepID=A0A7H0FYU9_9GAMM|nr:M23 family metallopeptidase [Lysobacter terrestris]QNP41215.1 M23 family metallopeptidase [Lysobacter terrestris]
MSVLRCRAVVLATVLACGLAPGVHAAKVYKWTDRNGVTHYGDSAPEGSNPAVKAGSVQIIPVAAEPSAVARLRVEASEGRYLAFADNNLAGPIEVQLQARGGGMQSDPPLPARATVPARGTTLVAVLDGTRGGELLMDSLPGDPSARPRDYEYVLPLQQRALRIDQGFGGSFSHNDQQNRYAVDFAADIGTPVLAAREGVVMQVENDFAKAGLNRERYGGRANFIRILHDDGTMALYAHLKSEGAMVRVGQRVRAGQQIGLSGNTGFTTGPHLHFVVQVNRGMKLESLPFRMRGPTGPLRIAGGAGH